MYLMRQFLFIILLLASSYSHADNARQIELTDGSIISGEIISFTDGIYTIRSTSLGTLEIEEARIVSIHLQTKPQTAEKPSVDNSEIQDLSHLLGCQAPPCEKTRSQFRFLREPESQDMTLNSIDTTEAASSETVETVTAPTLQALQRLLMGDEEIMGTILALKNDPAIQEVLSNPAVTEAVKSGDLSTLLSDPTFLKLLENPQIQAIQKKLSQ